MSWASKQTCLDTQECADGSCIDKCIPACSDSDCGPDGCGGVCGVCTGDDTCEDGICAPPCAPECDGMACGGDGCGGQCGEGCQTGQSCVEGVCEDTGCQPACGEMLCGDDGCGGFCGFCDSGECVEGECECTPMCIDGQCGDDGCGGSCSECTAGFECQNGACVKSGTDGGTCLDILGCMNSCAQSDNACLEACYLAASTNGQARYDAIQNCAVAAGCQETLCLAESCAAPIAECNFTESGTQGCLGILQCFGTCNPATQECLIACIEQGTKAAQAAYMALNLCVQTYCPQGTAPSCQQDAVNDPNQCGGFFGTCQTN